MSNTNPDPRAEKKRRDVLNAARRRFMEDGYACAGMEQIAREATVSTATLYSYFAGKADLFREVIEDTVQEMSRRMHDVMLAAEGDAETHLRLFVRTYAQFMAEPNSRALFRLIASERKRFEPTASWFWRQAQSEFGTGLIGVLKRLSDEGAVAIPDFASAAGQLLGMVEHPTLTVPMIQGDEILIARSVDDICDEALATFYARYGVKARVHA